MHTLQCVFPNRSKTRCAHLTAVRATCAHAGGQECGENPLEHWKFFDNSPPPENKQLALAPFCLFLTNNSFSSFIFIFRCPPLYRTSIPAETHWTFPHLESTWHLTGWLTLSLDGFWPLSALEVWNWHRTTYSFGHLRLLETVQTLNLTDSSGCDFGVRK